VFCLGFWVEYHHRLHEPLPISVAVNNTSCSNSHLYEYVKIALFAPDSSYVSCTVKAIITPGLCVPLLLGLPFLVSNNIVANFVANTTIDKTSNIDLLNPPVRVCQRKLIELSVSIPDMKHYKKAVLRELVAICKERLQNGVNIPEYVKPLDVTGMVKDWIEVLALQKKFVSLEKEFLSDYRDVFKPLPHVDKLPCNVTAQIKLRDAEQMIKTQMYACLHKFHEAWQTLIQQHLDAG
jgi:hypothetical protein